MKTQALALALVLCSPWAGEAFLSRQPFQAQAQQREDCHGHLPASFFQRSILSSSTSDGLPPLPARGGGKISRKKSTGAFDNLPDNVQQWLNTDEWPEEIRSFNISLLTDNFDSIRDNLIGQEGQVGKRGELYFAAQVVIGLCILTGGIPLLGGLLYVIMGPGLLLSGLATCFLTATRMGKSLTPWPVPVKSTQLMTSGFYGQVRHPMYAGLLAACTGLSVLTDSLTRLLLTGALLYVLVLKVDYEERALVEQFGSEYEQYRERVPGKFFPKALLEALPWNNNKGKSKKSLAAARDDDDDDDAYWA